MEAFRTVMNFFMNQKSTIGYSFMALLTIGGERIFSMVSFQCPCNHRQNFSYGLTFLLGPAAVLLVSGFFFSGRLWRLVTGCCGKSCRVCTAGKCLRCAGILLKVAVKACVAPLMWLSVALLNGTFYECAVSGLNNSLLLQQFCRDKTRLCLGELSRVPCSSSTLSKEDNIELLLMLRAQSQIIGWCIIISAAVAGLVGTCYNNCRSKVSYLQLNFWRLYMDKERQQFEALASEYAAKLADRNLRSFFENRNPEAFPFPNHAAWEKISNLYTFSRGDQSYSTLQRYVESTDRDYSPDNHDIEMRPVSDTELDTEIQALK